MSMIARLCAEVRLCLVTMVHARTATQLVVGLLFWSSTGYAAISSSSARWTADTERIWDTHAGKFITLQELKAEAGDIIVVGEDHATEGNTADPETTIHHDNQMRLIKHLQMSVSTEGLSLSVGMEFLTYTFQSFVDQFLSGTLPESDFLREAHWNSNPFEFYRKQILSSADSGGKTIALNIPAEIAGKVAHAGPYSLTTEERALLPPMWERGNDAYFERFAEAMKDHVPSDALENYFWAQSLWDNTMAWKAHEYRKTAPSDVMVIIVGGFHVEYGGGLPFELRKLGAQVKTVMQIVPQDWNGETLRALIDGDAKYGPHADYVWLHSGVAPLRRM